MILVDLRTAKIVHYYPAYHILSQTRRKRADFHMRIAAEFFAADLAEKAKDPTLIVLNHLLAMEKWSQALQNYPWPQQVDDHSCGVFFVYAAMAQTRQRVPDVSNTSPENIRRRLFAEISKR